MSSNDLPLAGVRETLGDMLIMFAGLAFFAGLLGRQDPVLLGSAPMLIVGLLLRHGRPTAALFHIPIRLPMVSPVLTAPSVALLVIATRWIVLQ